MCFVISLPHTEVRVAGLLHRRTRRGLSNLARYDGVNYGLRVTGQDIRLDVRADPRHGLRRRGAPAAS